MKGLHHKKETKSGEFGALIGTFLGLLTNVCLHTYKAAVEQNTQYLPTKNLLIDAPAPTIDVPEEDYIILNDNSNNDNNPTLGHLEK